MDARDHLSKLILLAVCLLTLHGCGDGDSDNEQPEQERNVQLSGSVGDGPVIHANLRFRAHTGEVLHTVTGDQWATYNVEFKTKGKNYPVLIDATGGIDLVTDAPLDFTLLSALTEPRNRAIANLNPFTTLAMTTARQMPGGRSPSNVSQALALVIAEFNSGLTSLAVSGPMTTRIDNSNLAEIVKSSEVLAEVFRRTSAVMAAEGTMLSIDGVIERLGADLIDGALDGRGAALADPHVSAVAVLANAQVLVEAMTNTLTVHGLQVTALLDGTVRQLSEGRVTTTMASLPITAGMIESARSGVAGAQAIAPSSALSELAQSLATLRHGMSSSEAELALPLAASAAFEPALALIASGSSADIAAINRISGGNGSNAAPTISGTPPTAVVQGTTYAFTPTASDADGDPLTFTIVNRPGWAAFSAATGALTGQPREGDVGLYTGIRIAVTDGQASAALPEFSIEVQAVGAGAATLSWVTPTENEDGSPLTDLAGYVIHWGLASGNYTSSIAVANPGITTYIVDGLPSGTHYFAVTAVNSSSMQSDFSNEVAANVL